MHHLGSTRSSLKHDHLLQTPDTFIRTPLPGAEGVDFIVHAGPQLGARFTQMTAEFQPKGTLGPTQAQRFLFVLEGELAVEAGRKSHALKMGGFCYLPHSAPHSVQAKTAARVAVIEKSYEGQSGAARPEFVFGQESKVAGIPLMGDQDLIVRALMPDGPSYDFAVNTMTYAPGAALSMVEIHLMEHGLLMLEGGGIYRLGDSWYPVQAGDFIWMRAYCPQWFGAIGKGPAKYLIYKDWRRHPLGRPAA
ncbi:MAG TPA: (S)-ureidoglycine aminohydrolase [Terracidiphilus sp.]|nr:(S)-ureidoglycine aminohydrolase [Terracidiphilus sp.]